MPLYDFWLFNKCTHHYGVHPGRDGSPRSISATHPRIEYFNKVSIDAILKQQELTHIHQLLHPLLQVLCICSLHHNSESSTSDNLDDRNYPLLSAVHLPSTQRHNLHDVPTQCCNKSVKESRTVRVGRTDLSYSTRKVASHRLAIKTYR